MELWFQGHVAPRTKSPLGCAVQSAAKFKEYADECRRLMAQASAEHRERLRLMAEAWDRCAEAAELADDAATDVESAANKNKQGLDGGSSS
jgi:hypothetical protein